MNILSVYEYESGTLKITDSSGEVYFVPKSHRFYQEAVEWKKEGNAWEVEPSPSLAEMKQAKIDEIRSIVHVYLSRTDWHVVKKMETGTEIPANVATYRQTIRDTWENEKAKIGQYTQKSQVENHESDIKKL